MNKLLRKLTLFLVPIILVGFFIEIYLRKTKNCYELKANQMLENASKINVLILGNSHATYGVDPNQFDFFAFNAAQVSQSIYFDKRITLKYLDKLKNLKYVLISLDYHSLYFSSQDIRNDWSYYGYGINYKNNHSFITENICLQGYTPKLATTSLLKYSIKKKYNDKLYAIDLEEGVDIDKTISKGWFGFKNTDVAVMKMENYKNRVNSFSKMINNSQEKKEIIADLEDFIVKLKNKNITPILFTTPCYSEYNILLKPKILNNNKLDITYLTNKYKIEYWNYLELPLPQTDFYNCDHLNAFGANKFSKILNKRIIELSKKQLK
jgi:hypothetical protein